MLHSEIATSLFNCEAMRGHLKVRFIYIDCVGLILYGLDLRISPALRYASVVLTRCVSVCLSVTSRCSIETSGRI